MSLSLRPCNTKRESFCKNCYQGRRNALPPKLLNVLLKYSTNTSFLSLPRYYMNLNQNPRTLLPKFFGLYCYQCNSKNVRLVAMNNLLPSYVRMHLKYDLKGSTYKRKVWYYGQGMARMLSFNYVRAKSATLTVTLSLSHSFSTPRPTKRNDRNRPRRTRT